MVSVPAHRSLVSSAVSTLRRAATALIPLTLCLLVIVVLLPTDAWSKNTVHIALVLQVAVGGLMIAGKHPRAPWIFAYAGIAGYMVSIALLRAGVGATSGFGVLVLLPVMWAAVEGRRAELCFSIASLIAVYLVPLLTIGAPQYPSSGWRVLALTVVMAGAVGLVVIRLVERLRSTNRRARATMAAMNEGLVLTRDGEIISVNRALCELTGYTKHELLGAHAPYPFWPPDQHASYQALRQEIIDRGGGEWEVTLQAVDGRRFPAMISTTPTDLGDGSAAYLSTIRDITERRDHEEEQRRAADQMVAIASVTSAIGHSDPADARPTICAVAHDLAEARAVVLWERRADGSLSATASHADVPGVARDVAAEETEHGAHVVLRTAEPLLVADINASRHGDWHLAGSSGAVSMLFHPVADGDAILGILGVGWSEPVDALSEHERLIFQVLADESAIAMQRADLLARLDTLTRTDELTGLPNRRAWDEALDRELATARRHERPLAVAILDLDRFKAYNDERGHLAGDRLLRAAAAAWGRRVRESDTLARWGGEEFALLLPGSTASEAVRLVERLRGTLPDSVTFSAGVGDINEASDARTLMSVADDALYRAKDEGRDQVRT